MSPIAMTVILVTTLSALVYSLNRRWRLMLVAKKPLDRSDRIPERLKVLLKFAFGQKKLPYYPLAGFAHMVIFYGFLVLLLRSLMLWGRAFVPDFNLWILGPEPVAGIPLGHIYDLSKDIAVFVVLVGAFIFVYLRTVVKDKRMSLHWEGLAILGIIIVMMIADVLYDGAAIVLQHQLPKMSCGSATGEMAKLCQSVQTVAAPYGPPEHAEVGFLWHAPLGSLMAIALKGLSASTLVVLAHIGFWVHGTLVLIFANILPYTKHFHIITIMPAVFTSNLDPPGRLPVLAKDTEELMEMVEKATDKEDVHEDPIGIARVEHFTWKAVLDLYTCTECGRCSDNCPAFNTGKLLSPKQFTIDVRNFMYKNDEMLINGVKPSKDEHEGEGHEEHGDEHGHGHDKPMPDNPIPDPPPVYEPVDLLGNVIDPQVVWACTTCRACEEFCPVMITYVDKFVEMRRNQVLIDGEFPPELAAPFEAMETNGNPWNISRLDRAAWAEGLDVPTMADKPNAEVLLWVGCSASYDDRSKKIARATVRLLKEAGVDFAILGEEETCSGDPARRAGNEFLFQMLAEQNIETLNGYKEQGGIRTILTLCPHCFNTLGVEYKDFGGDYNVVHHTDFLLDLVKEGKLKPNKPLKQKVVYHDSCYLGRYNDIYDSPRELLKSIPGLELVEVEHYNRNRAVCCGAGGAQMFMEEQKAEGHDRMNVRRTKQLLGTGAETIASACPFCMTMITDGLKDQEKEDDVAQLDIAEILAQSCLGDESDSKDGNQQAEQGAAVEA